MFSALLPLALLLSQNTAGANGEAVGLTVNVQKLPASYKQAPMVHLTFDDKGAATACTIEQSSGSPGIDKVACQQAQAQVKLPAKKKKAPEPISMAVNFVPAAAPAQ